MIDDLEYEDEKATRDWQRDRERLELSRTYNPMRNPEYAEPPGYWDDPEIAEEE